MSYRTATASGSKKGGQCVLCGDKVYRRQEYITTSDGYCHRDCLF